MPRHNAAATVDATGTRRRLQALCFMGHTQTTLAAKLGVASARLSRLLHHHGAQVDPVLAARVRRVYDELWNVVPAGPVADRTRTAARQSGWVSPLAWDDETIDDPDAAPDLGTRITCRAAALTEDSNWLLRFGYPFEVAAERLGVTPDYLKRARERARHAPRKAVAA